MLQPLLKSRKHHIIPEWVARVFVKCNASMVICLEVRKSSRSDMHKTLGRDCSLQYLWSGGKEYVYLKQDMIWNPQVLFQYAIFNQCPETGCTKEEQHELISRLRAAYAGLNVLPAISTQRWLVPRKQTLVSSEVVSGTTPDSLKCLPLRLYWEWWVKEPNNVGCDQHPGREDEWSPALNTKGCVHF